MRKRCDATTKRLLSFRPHEWIGFFGLPGHNARPLDTDLSTVTASADRLYRIDASTP